MSSTPENSSIKNQSADSKALRYLLALGLIYTLYFAGSLLVPVVIALLLSLMLSPAVNLLGRFYIPRAISAALFLAAIGVPFTMLGMELVEPAQKWVERVPELTTKVNEKLTTVSEVLAPPKEEPLPPPAPAPPPPPPEPVVKEKESNIFNLFGLLEDDEEPEPAQAPEQTQPQVQVQPPAPPEPSTALSDQLMVGGLDFVLKIIVETPKFLVQCLTCIILVLFLLVYGQAIYHTAINILPRIRDKNTASQLAADIRKELSRYIFTVSLINLALGLTTAGALWLMDFEDPLLWGALVGLLNFVPYLGSILSLLIISTAGFAQYGFHWDALYPAAAYFVINSIEAQIVTPAVLGRNMRMNPLIILLWLMIWGWLWGAAGVLIAMPLLVCIKLILARLGLLGPWIKLLETRA